MKLPKIFYIYARQIIQCSTHLRCKDTCSLFESCYVEEAQIRRNTTPDGIALMYKEKEIGLLNDIALHLKIYLIKKRINEIT